MSIDDDQHPPRPRSPRRFRDINDSSVQALTTFHGVDGTDHGAIAGDGPSLALMCECALSNCDAMVTITVAGYRAARSSGDCFIVVPDHTNSFANVVLEDCGDYAVVSPSDDE